MLLTTLQNHIRELATINENKDPVITCYLNLENGLKDARKTYNMALTRMRKALDGASHKPFEEAAGRIKRFLSDGNLRGPRGMAVFARGGKDAFFLPLEFGVAVPNWVTVDTLPNIYHLVELKDTYHRYVILLANEQSARVMEVHLGGITASLWQERPELQKRVGREWTKHHYQDHRRARTDQFFKDVGRTLEQSMAAGGYKHLILAGTPEVTNKIQSMLPKHLDELVLDSIVATKKDEPANVVRATLATFIEEEQRESLSRVQELRRELRSRGLAAIGREETIRALEFGQVDVLVLARELEPEIRESLVRLAERTGAEIETVESSEWLIENEGVGALLRYWIPGLNEIEEIEDLKSENVPA